MPKKRGPDHRVPVIKRAISEREPFRTIASLLFIVAFFTQPIETRERSLVIGSK